MSLERHQHRADVKLSADGAERCHELVTDLMLAMKVELYKQLTPIEYLLMIHMNSPCQNQARTNTIYKYN